jgi:hypothetical protein
MTATPAKTKAADRTTARALDIAACFGLALRDPRRPELGWSDSTSSARRRPIAA